MSEATGQFVTVFIPYTDSMPGLEFSGDFLYSGRQDAAASRPADGFRAACVNQQGSFNSGAESQPAFAELQTVFPGDKQGSQLFPLQNPGDGIGFRTRRLLPPGSW